MTIGDLIQYKDYAKVYYYILGVQKVFAGIFKSENGNIISLDRDDYAEDEFVFQYCEWTNEDGELCLDVVV